LCTLLFTVSENHQSPHKFDGKFEKCSIKVFAILFAFCQRDIIFVRYKGWEESKKDTIHHKPKNELKSQLTVAVTEALLLYELAVPV